MELDTGAGEAEAPLAKFTDPDWTAKRRAARHGRAGPAGDAVDQHRHALQHHLPELLHRIEPQQRPARLHHGAPRSPPTSTRSSRRARHARDRLHRRRAVHEPAAAGHAGGRAGARLRGAGADQRHAADAAAQDPGRACSRCATASAPGSSCASASTTTRRTLHEAERGARTWAKTIAGLDWLARNGFAVAIAGRTCWNESEADSRAGYARLIARQGLADRSRQPAELVLLPEMDGGHDVPEITTRCWAILDKRPGDMMCATSRMVVKRQGAERPSVVPCTLIPYDAAFEMGADAGRRGGRAGRHVRRRRRQAVPSALLEVLRARRRQLLGALR